MNRKGPILAGVAVGGAVLLWMILREGPPPEAVPARSEGAATRLVEETVAEIPELPPDPVPAKPVDEVPLDEPVVPDPAAEHVLFAAPVMERTARLHQPGTSVQDDLEILNTLMTYSLSIFKSMPAAGLNEEFVAHLTGENEKGVRMLPPDHPSINARGELVDRWGTPYFFHPISERVVEITSAGPDRVLFTEDDVAGF